MRIAAAALALGIGVAGCGAKIEVEPGDASPADPDGGDVVDARVPDAAPPDAAPCTGGDTNTTDQGVCYEAFVLAPLPWLAAEAACVARGGHLARIDSLIENTLIAGLVGMTRAWIGGTDTPAEGTFTWRDGASFATTFTHWRTGEPNNGNGNFEEDCAVIEGQNVDPTWDDRPCDTDPLAPGIPGQYAYVCER